MEKNMKEQLNESLDNFYENTKEYVNSYNDSYENYNVEDLVLNLFIETLLIENGYYECLRWYAQNNDVSLHELALDIHELYNDLGFNTSIYKLMDNLERVIENYESYDIDANSYDLCEVFDKIAEYDWD